MPLIQVLDSRRLRKAVDYMRAHLHAGITVADIAGAIQLSPFTLPDCSRQQPATRRTSSL
jgi:transcriptional regulator GlxA family with amidase domain